MVTAFVTHEAGHVQPLLQAFLDTMEEDGYLVERFHRQGFDGIREEKAAVILPVRPRSLEQDAVWKIGQDRVAVRRKKYHPIS
jgi:hypothetical protein